MLVTDSIADPWPFGADPDPFFWLTDPDPDPIPDPTPDPGTGILVSDLQDDNEKLFFS